MAGEDETVMATLPAGYAEREDQEVRRWAVQMAVAAGATTASSAVKSAALIYNYVKGESA